jgi:glycoside/pentoside/hexuronide:cation symporter, GPH family
MSPTPEATSPAPREKTDPKDRVSLGSKTAYGLGGLAENTMHNSVNNMANPVFNVGLGVAPALIGVATSIFRLWDAITDPVMGVISDRFESRFGRRKPFILIGALLSALFFIAIWWAPTGLSETGYFFWFLGVSLLFYTGFTVFGVPYLAMGYELSPDYHERTRVMAFRTWFASVGGIGIQWLFWLTQRDIFENTVEGMRWVGLCVGVVLLLCAAAPGLFVKERKLTDAERTHNRENIKFRGMFSVFKVKPFLYIFGALITAVLGMFMVAILGFYINVYYVFGGDLKASSTVIGVSGSFYHLCCLISVPLITWTSTRMGKRKTLIVFLGLAIVATIGKWWLFTPAAPYAQLIVTGLLAPGLSALWTLLGSMIADVTDYDELENGTRREGSFGAIYNWTLKLGFAVCFLIAGFILQASGFDEKLGGNQSADTITTLRFLYSAVPVIGLAAAIVCIWRFPIDEARANEIREKLKLCRDKP